MYKGQPRWLAGFTSLDQYHRPYIELWPIAYQSEEMLASVLAHEYVHVIDPRSGGKNEDEDNGPAARIGVYCATGKWPPLK